MADLPSGTVTFFFTDLEVSTRLWDQEPDAMRAALARHDTILREAVATYGGQVVKGRGDGVHAVFATADAAVRAAVDAQLAIGAEAWEVSEPLRVRIGIHSGVAELRDGDYFGAAVNRAARLEAVAHGGQILCSQSTADLARDSLPRAVDLIDLGEHTLRDLSRPERVFQVSTSGLAGSFAPLQSLGAFPGNLPVQMTSFVGRRAELDELSEVLHDARIVTITGPGGVGKTRVAVQLAAELLQRYADGAWLFELAAVTDAEAMVELVAATLSVAPRPGVSLEGAVVELLRAKRALVVLDNCEHLVDAAAQLAEKVLRECEHVRVVATSREALGIAGERVWPLRSLPVPDVAASPAAVEASDAGRLFSERAVSARPGFVVDASNAAAVVEICRRLDGIPLAIQLAAARLVAMTPTEIAGLLDERFRLLTGGRHAAVERHRTLRAAVEWSYGLLEPVDRSVFDRLGVFVGTFDAAAATAVIGGSDLEAWDVIDALSSLVAKSMLIAETEPTDTTRYQMLETLRQHACECLDLAGDADEFRRRHAQYYAHFAEQAGAALVGPDELAWRPRVDSERDNLRAAVYWALDRDDDDVVLALRIIAALAYESLSDPFGGIGAWAERAFDVALRSSALERTAVIGAAAYQATYLGHDDLVLSRAATLPDGLDADSAAPGLALFAAMQTLRAQGEQAEGTRVAIEAIHLLERTGTDPFGLVMFHSAASYWAVDDDDLATARAEAESALDLARRIENPSAIASGWLALARSIERDDPLGALEAFERVIALGRVGAMRMIMGPALVSVARLRSRMHDRLSALEALEEAIAYSRDVGYRPIVIEVLGPGAEILLRAGEPAAATVLAGSLLQGAFPAINAFASSHRSAELEGALVAARDNLGPEQYERMLARGASMSYDEVVEFALDSAHRAMAEANDR
jgi:predicted ATPase/class 3 adenylate cyclase